jgi:hypothetical protein
VQCAFQSRNLCHSTVGIDGMAGAPIVLKIYEHSSHSLHFFGTFILELFIEFFFAAVMFIKVNANGQVRLR